MNIEDDKTIADSELSEAEQANLKHTKPFERNVEPIVAADDSPGDPDREALQRKIKKRMEGSGARIRKDPLIGQVFGGRFEIVSKIGAGGMGVVYRASQRGMDRNVAVKVLLKEYLSNETAVRRFEREALAVSRLEHPNTVRIYDFGENAEGLLYIAMEFLAGAPLSRVLEQERSLSVRQTLRVVRQICLSLDEAHGKGIVHRDLKPDNVFLSKVEGQGDTVKVLDFGVAKLREGADEGGTLTQHGVIFGTPKYMSPEQCRSQTVDARSDLYSVGVMMYEMLSGQVPFQADNSMAILIMHANDMPDALSEVRPDLVIPFEVEELLHRLLAKEAEDRPADAKAAVAEIDNLLTRVPDEFEQPLTYESAEKAGMNIDRSQAYTVPDAALVSDRDKRALHGRAEAMGRETMAIDAPPLPTPLWKKLALALAVAVVLIGAGGGFVYSQVSGLPAPSRAVIPASYGAGAVLTPESDMVSVTISANLANVTVVDESTGEVLGELGEAAQPKTWTWIKEPGRTADVLLKHGNLPPIRRTIDLGLGGELEPAVFAPPKAGTPVVDTVTLSLTTNAAGGYLRIQGMDAAFPISAQGTREVSLPRSAEALEIRVEKPGFKTAKGRFTPAADGQLSLTLEELPKEPEQPAPVTIEVTTIPGRVKLRLLSTGQVFETPAKAKAKQALTLPYSETPVALECSRRGYVTRTVSVTPNSDQPLEITLEKRVRTRPQGASKSPGQPEVTKKPPAKTPPESDSLKLGPMKRIR